MSGFSKFPKPEVAGNLLRRMVQGRSNKLRDYDSAFRGRAIRFKKPVEGLHTSQFEFIICKKMKRI